MFFPNPMAETAALAGIGLTSQNSALISGIRSICILAASFTLPSKKSWHMRLVSYGIMLERTEMTPCPPTESIGTIWSSFPL